MSDKNVGRSNYRTAVALTKSDVTTYSPLFDAIYVGAAGAVSIVDGEGNTVVFGAVTAGTLLPIAVYQLLDATVATSVVGLRY